MYKPIFKPIFKQVLLTILLLCSLVLKAETQVPTQILQLVDYVGIDYGRAVSEQGKVLSPTEYEEMKEFTKTIERLLMELPRMSEKTVLQSKAKKLTDLVAGKATPEAVRILAQTLSEELRTDFNIITAPTFIPDVKLGARLYQKNCVSCHGVTGQGDGPLAAALNPAPSSFHDTARMAQLSTFGLYNTLSLGVEGTAMMSYQGTMNDTERWALALYVSGLSATQAEINEGRALWEAGHNGVLTSLKSLMIATKNSVMESMGGTEGPAVLAYLRHDPEAIRKANPFTITLNWLEKSIHSYEAGDAALGYQQALLAYVDGFETAEAVIDVVSGKEVRLDVEARMGAYRRAIEKHEPLEDVQIQYDELVDQITQMRDTLPTTQFSPATVFASSFVILLREGLESILIISMLVMMIIKAERRPLLLGVHWGWIAALVAGVATWGISHVLIHIPGAARELTEGVTALVAAAILLYVGLWMHTHNIAHDWRTYLKNRLNKHLKEGAWFGLFILSFLAVYREVFETILFYEALSMQSGAQGMRPLLMGIGAAAVVLGLVVLLMVRFGLKLPLQRFFKVSAVMIFAFALIFVGQGIHSLSEIGWVPVWTLPFIHWRVDMLGIYPNLFGLLVQGLIIWVAFRLRRSK